MSYPIPSQQMAEHCTKKPINISINIVLFNDEFEILVMFDASYQMEILHKVKLQGYLYSYSNDNL